MSDRAITFIDPQPGLTNWLEQMRAIYQTYNVYRTIIIVDDEKTATFVATELTKDQHSVFLLRSSQYELEFQDFLESGKRVLVLEYEDYKRATEAMTYFLMDQHNLLVLENLERFQESHVLDFINGCIHSGFMKFLPYQIWVN